MDTIQTKSGEQFSFEVEEFSDGGYLCQIKFDKDCLRLLDKRSILPKALRPYKNLADMAIGSNNKLKFTFLALKSGNTEISHVQKRPWEDEHLPETLKVIQIEIS